MGTLDDGQVYPYKGLRASSRASACTDTVAVRWYALHLCTCSKVKRVVILKGWNIISQPVLSWDAEAVLVIRRATAQRKS